MHLSVLACIYVCHYVCVWCTWMPEEGTGSPRIVVTDEPLCGWEEPNPGPMQERVLFIAEPSLQVPLLSSNRLGNYLSSYHLLTFSPPLKLSRFYMLVRTAL